VAGKRSRRSKEFFYGIGERGQKKGKGKPRKWSPKDWIPQDSLSGSRVVTWKKKDESPSCFQLEDRYSSWKKWRAEKRGELSNKCTARGPIVVRKGGSKAGRRVGKGGGIRKVHRSIRAKGGNT